MTRQQLEVALKDCRTMPVENQEQQERKVSAIKGVRLELIKVIHQELKDKRDGTPDVGTEDQPGIG